MPNQERVAGHYTHGSLLDAILAGLEKLGKTADDVTLDDLGPVEETSHRIVGRRPRSVAHILISVGPR